ncbi:MAG: cobalt ECF transporter T component CbiQ [Thermodesulfatator sp.]|nr:MAG: cobalt ECF transporter T component CbiQ [Thermodesulfatator sp.]
MHLPEIDRYAHGQSPLHRLDPRLKLLALVLLLLATNLTRQLPGALIALSGALGLVLLSRLPLPFLLWHLKAPALLALLLGLGLALFTPGEPLLGPITAEGLLLGITLIMKVLACFLYFLALVATAPLFSTIRAARSLGIPEKLLALLIFTYRYLFVFLDRARNLSLAMQARGFREGTNKHTYETKARLYALLFLRAYEDTERILLAMQARGFSSPKVPGLPPLNREQLLQALPLFTLPLALLALNFLW